MKSAKRPHVTRIRVETRGDKSKYFAEFCDNNWRSRLLDRWQQLSDSGAAARRVTQDFPALSYGTLEFAQRQIDSFIEANAPRVITYITYP
jgi:hypothetical protein